MGGEPWAKEQRYAWRPWQQSTVVENQQELHTPQRRTETISSGSPDTLWRQHVLHLFSWDTLNPIKGGAVHPLRTYRPRERVSYDWFGSVVRPAVPAGTVPRRTGDALDLQVAELAGNDGTTYDRSGSERDHDGAVRGRPAAGLRRPGMGHLHGDLGAGRLPPRARRRPDQGPAVGVLHDDEHDLGVRLRPARERLRGPAPARGRLRRAGRPRQHRTRWALRTTRASPSATPGDPGTGGAAARPGRLDLVRRRRDLAAAAHERPGQLSERDRVAPAGGRVRLAAGPGHDRDGNSIEQTVVRAYGIAPG